MSEEAITPVEGGTMLRVRVQPRASRTKVVGLVGGEVKVAVTAPPVKGEANKLLLRHLARLLGIPRSSVTVAGGVKGRSKLLRIEGLSPEEVRHRILA